MVDQSIDHARHYLEALTFLPSPHCDQRPSGVEIDLLVIHNISLPPNQFGNGAISQFFQGQLDINAHAYFKTVADLRVSAHVVIDRLGQITQYVPFAKRAWHAGESIFEAREHCNDFSIGIELEGADHIPYEKTQYICLATLTKALMVVYPGITPARIVGHCDIAPGRKTDPGNVFDWSYFYDLLT